MDLLLSSLHRVYCYTHRLPLVTSTTLGIESVVTEAIGFVELLDSIGLASLGAAVTLIFISIMMAKRLVIKYQTTGAPSHPEMMTGK